MCAEWAGVCVACGDQGSGDVRHLPVAYERLTALFGVCGVGWSMCRLTATRVVVMCATCRWLMNA
ncbi:MAG: hypothetical protein IKC89_03280 [Lentisphaeria bacterium]|nr:hypothetical protein [Lentisphaeria bacterium]